VQGFKQILLQFMVSQKL